MEDTTSSGDVVPSSGESSMMGASQSSGELGTVTIVNLGNGQQRYEMPEDLQQLGYTDCRLFSSGKTVLFFKGKPILVDTTRENWLSSPLNHKLYKVIFVDYSKNRILEDYYRRKEQNRNKAARIVKNDVASTALEQWQVAERGKANTNASSVVARDDLNHKPLAEFEVIPSR